VLPDAFEPETSQHPSIMKGPKCDSLSLEGSIGPAPGVTPEHLVEERRKIANLQNRAARCEATPPNSRSLAP
jgi:hypothetical protein